MRIGGGLQGAGNFNLLDQVFDSYLILSPDSGLVRDRGASCWLRPMQSVHIDGPAQDAAAVVMSVFAPYSHGVRNLVFPNEWIAVEGDPATPENYTKFNNWGVEFVKVLRDSLAMSGMQDMRIWGPALSPGHSEDDNFEGYRILEPYLRSLDGIACHFYWTPVNGWLTDDDAEWWSRRIERARALFVDMGLEDWPLCVSEYNRKVDRDDPEDVASYCQQVREYNAYLAGLGYVEAAFTFLATNQDTAFDDLTLEKMPGALESLIGLKDEVGTGEPIAPIEPGPGEPEPPADGYTTDERGFEVRFSEYVEATAARRKWTPSNEPSTDEWNILRQDFTYTTTAGVQRYGTLSSGSGLNGYDAGPYHAIFPA